ncbi:MAG: hypothetical protein HXX08_11130 [Chloroflexi bacterium]|uniref:Uncharacterized protein n=1 Tax=Candidatus Chlorohelix allophototropha TaxID=3003348 RepID=A0A8T7M2S0_9CHLR|nr:hypothetical protein [Chloroflexota bacterium]WJW65789.1 hypothetical protein OZ401_001568 [Chloroflexota bacterium L227-S17]
MAIKPLVQRPEYRWVLDQSKISNDRDGVTINGVNVRWEHIGVSITQSDACLTALEKLAAKNPGAGWDKQLADYRAFIEGCKAYCKRVRVR